MKALNLRHRAARIGLIAIVGCCALVLLFCAAAPARAQVFKLPDTGQTKCYQTVSPYAEIPCAGTGQDGEYSINPLSYTDNGDGTVTDNSTGLMWQQEDDGDRYDWYQASGTYHYSYNFNSLSVCGSATTGNYADWRLPNIKELMSLIDRAVPNPGPTIRPIFTNTKPSGYWSSTTTVFQPDGAFYVSFAGGSITNYWKHYNGVVLYVRCVRGGEDSGPTLTDNMDNTVTDTRTGLVWQQEEPGPMTWGSALSYCNDLPLANKYDWRLPNVKELHSLVDNAQWGPAIDRTKFPGAFSSSYWSSTTDTNNPDSASRVNFDLGGGGGGTIKGNIWGYVRCVHGGSESISDDHGNSIGQATPVGLESHTGGQIEYAGDNDYFQIQVETAGTLNIYTLGTTDTYGYLLGVDGMELAHNDEANPGNNNFRIIRSVSPGTYFVRVRHFSPSGLGTYTLAVEFAITSGTPGRAVLLLHGMNSGPDTWNTLVTGRWSGVCDDIYDGVIPVPSSALPRDSLDAVCYRLRFGRYDTTGSTGLESRQCSPTSNPSGCKGDFTAIYAPMSDDLGVEVFAAVRAVLARLGPDTQVVVLGHSRGGLAARAFLQRRASSVERASVVGLVTTSTPHRGSQLGRIYPYLKKYCLAQSGARITSSNRAGKSRAVWSACEDDWEAVDWLMNEEAFGLFSKDPLDLRMPTISFLAPDSSQIVALNKATSLAALPSRLSVIQLRYTGQYLGHLKSGYSTWNLPLVPQAFPQFSKRSRNYALCLNASACSSTENNAQFRGDGIVPKNRQGIPGLGNLSRLAARTTTTFAGGTYHTQEQEKDQDIASALGRVKAWQ